MEKMRLVPVDQARSMDPASVDPLKKAKSSSADGDGDDVVIAKMQDAFIRKNDRKKILEQKNLDDFAKKVKPILSSSADNFQEVLKSFNGDEQALARTILNIIARLPKVSLVKNQLFIDGQIYDADATQMVKDIIKNKITGAESVLQLLRGANDNELSGIPDDDNASMMSYDETFDETLIPYLAREGQATVMENVAGAQASPRRRGRKKKSGPSPIGASTPIRPKVRTSPLKTRRQRFAEAVKKTKTVSPRDILQQLNAQGRKNGGKKPQQWVTYN